MRPPFFPVFPLLQFLVRSFFVFLVGRTGSPPFSPCPSNPVSVPTTNSLRVLHLLFLFWRLLVVPSDEHSRSLSSSVEALLLDRCLKVLILLFRIFLFICVFYAPDFHLPSGLSPGHLLLSFFYFSLCPLQFFFVFRRLLDQPSGFSYFAVFLLIT